MRRFRLAAAALLLLSFRLSPAVADDDHRTVCDAAALRAEQDWNVPQGVLSAVGTVESGRSNGQTVAPWPWTINVEGRGFYFESKEEAIQATVTHWMRGATFIDVGCFQVDLGYHGGQFSSIDDAFDPERNAQVAAHLLVRNRAGEGDWSGAVARYHSATPVLGAAYLQRVRAAFPGAQARALANAAATRHAAAGAPGARTIKIGHEPQIIYMGSTGTLPKVVLPTAAKPVS